MASYSIVTTRGLANEQALGIDTGNRFGDARGRILKEGEKAAKQMKGAIRGASPSSAGQYR